MDMQSQQEDRSAASKTKLMNKEGTLLFTP